MSTPNDGRSHSSEHMSLVLPPAALLRNGGLAANSMLLPIGTRLGEFEITGIIGEGGFGIVYSARDHLLQRTVAIKEYMPSALATRAHNGNISVRSPQHAETFETARRSFVNEARLLAQFDHPSLVKVHRFWEANGTAYMVMPYYQGQTLRKTIKGMSGPPSQEWLIKLLLPLLEALQTIHEEQCFHRDIAPDNILILNNGRPVLLDFGAARRVIGDVTQTLTVILKPGYAPLEQYAEGPEMRQGPWTDLYAMAAVVYFCVAGNAPPPAVARMMKDNLPPMAQAGGGRYGAAFCAAIDHCLRIRFEERTRSVDDFRTELLRADPVGNPGRDQMPDDRTIVMARASTPPTDWPEDLGGPPGGGRPSAPPASPPASSPPAPAPAPPQSGAIARTFGSASSDTSRNTGTGDILGPSRSPGGGDILGMSRGPGDGPILGAGRGPATGDILGTSRGPASGDRFRARRGETAGDRSDPAAANPFAGFDNPTTSRPSADPLDDPLRDLYPDTSRDPNALLDPLSLSTSGSPLDADGTREFVRPSSPLTGFPTKAPVNRLAEPATQHTDFILPGSGPERTQIETSRFAVPPPRPAEPRVPPNEPSESGGGRSGLVWAGGFALALLLALAGSWIVFDRTSDSPAGKTSPDSSSQATKTSPPSSAEPPVGTPPSALSRPSPDRPPPVAAGGESGSSTASGPRAQAPSISDPSGSSPLQPISPPLPAPAPPLPAARPDPVSPPTVATEFSMANLFDGLVAGQDPGWQVEVSVASDKLRINVDRLKFTVRSNRPGYLYVLSSGTDDQHLAKLFPNSIDRNNKLRADVPLTLPRQSWQMTAGGPAGQNQFVVLVTPGPRDFSSVGAKSESPFDSFSLNTVRDLFARQGAGVFAGEPKPCTGGDDECRRYGATRFTVREE